MIEYIINNADQIAQIVTTVIALASLIAAMTPSKTDNQVVKKIRKVANLLGLNVGNAKTRDD